MAYVHGAAPAPSLRRAGDRTLRLRSGSPCAAGRVEDSCGHYPIGHTGEETGNRYGPLALVLSHLRPWPGYSSTKRMTVSATLKSLSAKSLSEIEVPVPSNRDLDVVLRLVEVI